MTLGTIVSNGGKYVRVTLEGATEEGVIETTLQGVDEHLSVLDLRGTGLDPDEIDFPDYVNGEQKIYTDNPRLNQAVRNAGKYVRFTFEGEPASVEKKNLDYAFSTGGLVCGADMSVFTGLESINGINEYNDTCDLENLDTSEVVSADYAFRNSGKKTFILSEYPKSESMVGIIDNCERLTDIEINGCTDQGLCDSVVSAAKKSNLKTFSAEDVDLIEELDFENTESLESFAYSGLSLVSFKNVPDLSECTRFVLRSPVLADVESLTIGKHDGPLKEVSLEIPSLKRLEVSSGEMSVFDGNKTDNLEEIILDMPRLIKVDFSGTEKSPSKLKVFNLSGNTNLRYLDLSYTQIENLDISVYENLPYVVFDSTDKKTRKMIEGWKAQYCPNLKKATMLDSQAHPDGDDLSLDNDSLIGCSSLEHVVVLTDRSTVEMTGHETHYAKVDFLNDVTYKGKPLDEMGGGSFVPSISQSEYDKLSDKEKNNGQIREITDAEGIEVPFAILNDDIVTGANVLSASKVMEEIGKFDGKIEEVDNKNNYSTEETVVGTWIDGKPIYRKVTQVSIATNSTAWRSTGVEIPQNIKKTIRRELILDFSSETSNTSFMLRYNNGFVDIASINNTNVNITTNDFIVLEYTKTTD